jgi:D-alanine--poly(phosphoribitol) ligase subunit 1
MLPDVVDLFLAQAANNPDHPAIVSASQTISYGALERRVRTLAAGFVESGASKIAIALPPSIDAYAAMFAAGLAGAFYTPLNMGAPPAKQQRILDQIQPDILLGAAAALAPLTSAAKRFDPAALRDGPVLTGTGARHELAYVIFTSGSTGEPKGVMIPRQALAHYVAWTGRAGITRGDRVMQHANIAFDLSVFDIFGTLCHGGTLYPLEIDGDRLMPARFARRNAITIWNTTPSVVGLAMQTRQADAAHLGSVRLFAFCGEPLLKEHVDALFAAVPSAVVLNTYGPTEATVAMTELALHADDYERHCEKSVAIGTPIADMDIVLAGGPSADEGEIVIVGPQLAQGYWGDPEKSARAFKPVSGNDDRRGYFTGDWAHRRDGNLFFRARTDSQVKIRGHRIELGEVEAALRVLGFAAACAFKRGEVLVAIVETDGARVPFNEPAIRTALARKIEPHAIPEKIVAVERLPLNENDKLDRHRAAALMEVHLTNRRGA